MCCSQAVGDQRDGPCRAYRASPVKNVCQSSGSIRTSCASYSTSISSVVVTKILGPSHCDIVVRRGGIPRQYAPHQQPLATQDPERQAAGWLLWSCFLTVVVHGRFHRCSPPVVLFLVVRNHLPSLVKFPVCPPEGLDHTF
jgi:hypothetical protein